MVLLLCAACTDWFGTGSDSADEDDSAVDSDTNTSQDDSSEAAEDDARVRALTDLPEGDFPCRTPILARVTHISDGDTFYVQPDGGGQSLKIRLIGVDTPEIAHDPDPAECFGEEATAFTSGQLLDRLAWFTFDSECTDQFDRNLAYAIRGDGATGFFNRFLARQGYASALTIEPNDTYADAIESDVAQAKVEGLGMWESCP